MVKEKVVHWKHKTYDGKVYYLCDFKAKVNPENMTEKMGFVTCKKCINIMQRPLTKEELKDIQEQIEQEAIAEAREREMEEQRIQEEENARMEDEYSRGYDY